jgi:hypothetical protein
MKRIIIQWLKRTLGKMAKRMIIKLILIASALIGFLWLAARGGRKKRRKRR